jgi:hypothetical protein
MEKRVLSWGGEGSSSATEGTVGPSLAAVWVVQWMGMDWVLAKAMSFCVVVTLRDTHE